jgi:hypothetical protein
LLPGLFRRIFTGTNADAQARELGALLAAGQVHAFLAQQSDTEPAAVMREHLTSSAFEADSVVETIVSRNIAHFLAHLVHKGALKLHVSAPKVEIEGRTEILSPPRPKRSPKRRRATTVKRLDVCVAPEGLFAENGQPVCLLLEIKRFAEASPTRARVKRLAQRGLEQIAANGYANKYLSAGFVVRPVAACYSADGRLHSVMVGADVRAD